MGDQGFIEVAQHRLSGGARRGRETHPCQLAGVALKSLRHKAFPYCHGGRPLAGVAVPLSATLRGDKVPEVIPRRLHRRFQEPAFSRSSGGRRRWWPVACW
jgi:hypothetical protein